jgi:fibronectin-binding autotransporter adhesin
MKKLIITSLAAIGLSLGASAATIIAQWDFNSNPSDGSAGTGTLVPAIGSGTFTVLASLTTVYNTAATPAPGSSDPLGADANNSGLRLLGNWPAASVGNKTSGVQLFISTVGWQNVQLAWDQANSGSASKYYRIQYSIDNGATWVDKDVVVNGSAAANWLNSITNISFAAVPGANNNTNFGVRLVSEFESTATGSGAAAYVSVSTTGYSSSQANLRLDMMTFTGDVVTGNVDILSNPTDVTVAVGQSASFTVSAGGGTTPITYQWRKGGTELLNETNTVLSFPSAQLSDAAGYDVIVTNGVNSRTSAVATLTVRVPLSLAWTGLNGTNWDASSVNWVDTGANNVAYTGGDNALFDGRGSAVPTVSLVGSLNPSSVTVDSTSDYTFRTDSGGKIVGATGVTKRGTGTLILDTDNTYTGPTVIQAGTLQLGQSDTHGSLGTGSVTNNGTLIFHRTDSVTLANSINGNGSITNFGNVTLTGPNTYTGPVSANAGSLILSGNQTVSSSDLYVTASTNTGPSGATKLAVSGTSQILSAGTTLHFTGLTAAPDCRATFQSLSGNNVINGPTILEGNGAAAFETAGNGTVLTLNGNISGPSFSGSLFLRGANGSGILNGTINLPGLGVLKPDTSVWTINSTNNNWNFTSFVSGGIRLGAHNALPTGLTIAMGVSGSTATLDLNGFNQTIANLSDTGGTKVITNSSATANSTLTIGSGNYGGTVADSAAGPKTGLTFNGSFSLSGFNTYSGDTTVNAGTLTLTGGGDIPNCSVINLAGGGMDVSGRFDGSLPLLSNQTLKGNGNMAINGNLSNGGTIRLKVSKAGNVVSNDKVSVTGQCALGGTLMLDLSGQALNYKDTLPLFAAGAGFAGSVPTIVPAIPAPGAAWDTSTLLTDGVLRVYGPPAVTSTVISGGNITLSGVGGQAFASYYLLTASNLTPPVVWSSIQTNAFDGSGNFSVGTPIPPGRPQQYFRLQIP